MSADSSPVSRRAPGRLFLLPCGLHIGLLVGLLFSLEIGNPGEVLAQEPQRTPGAIHGRIVDMRSGEGIVNARVRLSDMDLEGSALTNSAGEFRLRAVPPGVQEIQVAHIAYGVTTHLVNVPEGAIVELDIRLGFSPIVLDSLVAEVEVRPTALLHAGFFERQRMGRGHFFHGDDTERWSPEQLLRLVPGVQDVQGGMSAFDRRIAMRVRAGLGGTCYPEVYLDGVRFRGLEGNLRDVAGGLDIAAVEVYRGHDTPVEFQTPRYPPCGAIVMWSRRD